MEKERIKRRPRVTVKRIPTSEDSPVKWALYYRNVLNLPVLPGEKGSKKPLVKWKEYQEKLPNPGEIIEWWKKWPDANIAMVTGKVGNLMVLDIDTDEGRRTIESYGDLPITPTIRTSRGLNYCFSARTRYIGVKEEKKFYPSYTKGGGWELKGDSALVMLPPSHHPSGAIYQWEIKPSETSLAPLPLWLIGILEGREHHDTEAELVELILPYWKEGQRHNLALGLGGYLCKMEWSWSLARQLFERIGAKAEDEELKDRLDTLEETYRKGQEGKPIAGAQILKDILSVNSLKDLERLAKEKQIPETMRRVDSVRLRPRKKGETFLTNREVGTTIIQDLKEKGHLLTVSPIECYWFDQSSKQVLSLDSPLMKATLHLTYGINPADELAKKVKEAIYSHTIKKGEQVEVYQGAHWCQETHRLYVHAGAGRMYKLDGENIVLQDNGSNGVFFEDMPDMESWEADLDEPAECYDALVRDLNFDTGEGVALNPTYQKAVFWLWLRTLFFEELQPTRPILALTGDTGSGKTTALRRIKKLLIGTKGQVSEIRNEDSWAAAITNDYFLVLDNLDKLPFKSLPDKLDRVATGLDIKVRQLYTTNEPESLRPRCFVSITSVHPPFTQGTVARRLLILRMQPLENVAPEYSLEQSILEQRNQLWGDLLKRLNKDVQLLKGPGIPSNFRMADFANLISKFLGDTKEGEKILGHIIRGLEAEQSAQVLGSSIIPQLLTKWEHDTGHWYSTAELYNAWNELSSKEGIHWPFKSPRSLGMHLANIRSALKEFYPLEWVREGHTQLYRFGEVVKTFSGEDIAD